MPADEFTPRFWGKLNLGPDGTLREWLSLPQHCLDVAGVFYRLVKLRTIRLRLEASAGRPLDDVILQRLAVIAFLHDVGKTNLGFQDKPFVSSDQPIRAGHVRELGPMFVDAGLQARFVEAIDAETLCGWFEGPETAMAYLIAAWSHHGQPQVYDPDVQAANHRLKARYWQARAGRDPFRAIADLLTAAKMAFPDAFAPGGAPIPHSIALQHRFAGLVMLADWLGSHRGFFPLQGVDDPAPSRSPNDARLALRAVGLDVSAWQTHLADHPSDFALRFGFPPRPLQTELDLWPVFGKENRLLIAEAETGAGKTEAALARFFRLFAAGEVDALYFALPTRVAARELYQRVARYVDGLFPADDRPMALLAVPGYARVDNVPVERLLPDKEALYQDDAEQARRERTWAAEHPKRFLAAPIAVGAIDQALLSALQTSHAHLRSVCLDRSLLVVDEVHASDPYMRRLLHGLLDHHLGVGGHALLLSATLGSRARAAFTGQSEPGLEEAIATPYPAVTDAGGVPRGLPADVATPPKPVRFDLRPELEHPETLLPDIAEALRQGARVLVVLNTVGRAVAFHRAAEAHGAIEPFLFRCGDVIAPHHGRFAPVDREVLDQAVTDALGKHSLAGARLLIGTQTLEQSLDIDADLLITDLCPMDVLLQRIGRLQRHWERPRPLGFGSARCIVLVPGAADLEALLDAKGEAIGAAKRAGLGSVYPDMRVLQLTRDAAWARPDVEIPRDNRRLVEEATHAERLATLTGARWEKHAQKVQGIEVSQEGQAEKAALDELYQQPFGECVFKRIAEEKLKTKTRLGLDAVRIRLNKEVISPFRQPLREMVIPGRLVSNREAAGEVTVIAADEVDEIRLSFGRDLFTYSRHGLEKVNG